MPEWLHTLSLVSLCVAAVCACIIALDVFQHPQKMWIMNIVWPTTALYAGPLALLFYFEAGRQKGDGMSNKPLWQSVALGALHCGSGCTLGDLVAEWITFAAPLVVFGSKLYGGWVVDYLWAYLFGIAFQYFSIKPMKNLSAGEGLWAAIKADTLSLTSWQIGMYGWMAIATFLFFGHELSKTGPVFWFMMQIAMLCGFCTACPINLWLIRSGVKEKM